MYEKLPDTREGLTHRVVIRGEPEVCPHCGKQVRDGICKAFFTVNRYPDGRVGEVFVSADQAGSVFDGFADCFAIVLSFALREGADPKKLVEKLSFQDFAPQGMTDNPEIPMAKSVVDYIARWIGKTFLDKKKEEKAK